MDEDIKIHNLQYGRDEAFEAIYRKYYKELYRFAFHYVLCDEAKDIVQDVFIKLYDNKNNRFEDMAIKTYLYSATKYGCVNFHRHLNIIDKSESRITETMLQCDECETRENEQKYEDLEKCLSELSPQQRVILELKAQGNDYKQIAETLNISQGTVNTHINRAYKYFRKKFFYFFLIFFAFGVYDNRCSSVLIVKNNNYENRLVNNKEKS